MTNIFEEQEYAARRQFHELFCTKFLYTGATTGALNDTPWNADILYDILQSIHPQNILTPQDIEAMLQIGGMCDQNGELYMHYHSDVTMLPSIVKAISPYIGDKAFVQCRQMLHNEDLNSVQKFLKYLSMDENGEYAKCPTTSVFNVYSNWCVEQKLLNLNRRTFYKELRKFGYTIRKGYVAGKSGISYIKITMSEEVLNKYGQPSQPKAKEIKQSHDEQDIVEQIRDVDRAGEEISPKPIEQRPLEIQTSEIEQPEASVSSDIGDYQEADTDNSSEDTIYEPELAHDDDDDFDWGTSEDEVADAEPETIAELIEARTIEANDIYQSAKDRVIHLPAELRQCFKMMKIDYRVAPEHFERKRFDKDIKATAGPQAVDVEDMWELFMAYANNKG